MQVRKIMQGTALALGLAAVLTIAAHKYKPFIFPPMVEERYFNNREKMLFFPRYNDKQPNKIIIETTPEVLEWMKKKGIRSIEPNPIETAKKINQLIYNEKKAPFDDQLKAYVKELHEKPIDMVTPADFFNRPAMCLEKSVFEAAVLRELGVNAQVLVLGTKLKDGNEFLHAVVVAKIGKKKLIFDPLYGIEEDKLGKYLERYYNTTEIISPKKTKIYPLVKYEKEFEKYLVSDEAERKLDKDFR